MFEVDEEKGVDQLLWGMKTVVTRIGSDLVKVGQMPPVSICLYQNACLLTNGGR